MIRKNQGYTLIELLCVLCLLTVVIGMAYPSFLRPLANVKLKADARQLAWVIRSSRQEAINTGVARSIKFYTLDENNQKYRVVGGKTYCLAERIHFVGTTNFPLAADQLRTCVCYPSGACSGGTAVLSNGYEKLYVIVNPIAGRVRISRDPP